MASLAAPAVPVPAPIPVPAMTTIHVLWLSSETCGEMSKNLQLREYLKRPARVEPAAILADDTWNAVLDESGCLASIQISGLPCDAEVHVFREGVLLGTTTMHVLDLSQVGGAIGGAGAEDATEADLTNNTFQMAMAAHVSPGKLDGTLSVTKRSITFVAIRRGTDSVYVFRKPCDVTVAIIKRGFFEGPCITQWRSLDGCA